MKFWNFLEILTFFSIYCANSMNEITVTLWFSNTHTIYRKKGQNFQKISKFHKISNFSRILCNKTITTQILTFFSIYCMGVTKSEGDSNFIHWICTRVQYDFLLHRNCFLLINMLENGMSRVLLHLINMRFYGAENLILISFKCSNCIRFVTPRSSSYKLVFGILVAWGEHLQYHSCLTSITVWNGFWLPRWYLQTLLYLSLCCIFLQIYMCCG
jgi:hypothetical protein